MGGDVICATALWLLTSAACVWALWRELDVRWALALLAPPALGVATLALAQVTPALTACAILSVVALCALICEVDRRHFLIPDVLVAALLCVALLAPLVPREAQITGAALAGGIFFLVRAGFRQVRGAHGLGLGDVKLAAVMGALLGPNLALIAVAIAAGATALILAVRHKTLTPPAAPFGVGLSAALAIALVFEAWR